LSQKIAGNRLVQLLAPYLDAFISYQRKRVFFSDFCFPDENQMNPLKTSRCRRVFKKRFFSSPTSSYLGKPFSADFYLRNDKFSRSQNGISDTKSSFAIEFQQWQLGKLQRFCFALPPESLGVDDFVSDSRTVRHKFGSMCSSEV
jgi:hypothetical protein